MMLRFGKEVDSIIKEPSHSFRKEGHHATSNKFKIKNSKQPKHNSIEVELKNEAHQTKSRLHLM